LVRQDSIQQQYTAVEGDSVVAVHRPLTPAQVLSWLPRNATPAQQDSAIQAHFKPGEIRWSTRPDTLHLPGHDRGHNMLDVNLPQYYREGFFSKDSLFHPELRGGRSGVAGDPVPYTVHSDNLLTGLLLLCLIMVVLAFANVKDFLVRQAKSFFYFSHDVASEMSETAVELRFQFFLVLLSCLLCSLLFYFYTLYFIGETFILRSPYYLILIYWGIFIAYYVLKVLLYSITNLVLFDSKRNKQWMRSFLFIVSSEGVLMFPVMMVKGYFDISMFSASVYVAVVLIIIKILTIYKCYNIFFKRNVVKLQIILYFCALEIVPFVFLWSVLNATANMLKINF
jgi:hypothetical protein